MANKESGILGSILIIRPEDQEERDKVDRILKLYMS